jgi:phosphoglycerol transferase MdoB-like AlkP superfamily enzyme
MQRFTAAVAAYRANRFLNAFNVLFAGMALLYRLGLAFGVRSSEAAPFGTEKGFKTSLLILTTIGNDIVVLIVLNIIFLAFYLFCNHHPGHHKVPNTKKTIYILCGFIALVFWHTMITGSHFNLLFNMNSGFTLALFTEFFSILGFRAFVTMLSTRDFAIIVLPITAFVLLWLRHHWIPRKKHIAAATITVFVLLVLGPLLGAKKLPDELRMNPHAYFLRDIARTLFKKGEALKPDRLTGKVYLDDKLFAKQKPESDDSGPNSREIADIVVIVLESNSSEYIFDTTKYAGGKMPMPYLHSLSSKSLYMSRHFASNNSSPRSIFSIFSGLYESPQTSFYAMEKNLQVPHLVDFLGKKYDSFLVTPADINWYFPKAWFKNRGFAQIHDYNTMKTVPEYKAGPTSVRDEFQSVEFFLNLATATKKPFLGVYYTFLGHWPYADVPPEYQLIKPDSSRSRYINNLYAQDKIIKRIITGFEKAGKFDNTIFVIVGDHGEAFYQHPGNRVHSGESYNENIASPLIIYSPRYIISQRIDYPTVHADIVPTLVDTLGIPYRKEQFQGESLNAKPVRRYVFSYGNENTLTAVSNDLKKMQIMRKDEGGCRYFDLKRDAAELNNTPCPTGSDHYKAIEAFFRVQPGVIKGYNELCNRTGC